MITMSRWMAVNTRFAVTVAIVIETPGRMTVDRGPIVAGCVMMVNQRVTEHGCTETDGKSLPATPLPAAGCSRSAEYDK
jgi:hypothetical protein